MLNLSIGNRSESTRNASVQVLEYDVVNGIIVSAAIDFYLTEAIRNDPWILGSVRYNSTIPLTTSIPEPSTYGVLAGISILGFVLWRRKARRTSSVSAGS
jgi:hypothetical protein